MRLINSLAALLAVCAGTATANIAYVLTFDPQTATGKHQIAITSLSPEAARLVLAQRAGAEDYHLTATPNDKEIEIINKYGAKSSIFKDRLQSRALLLAELPEEHESHTMLRLHARFTISNSPDFSATQDLFHDLYVQSHAGKSASIEDLRSESFVEHAVSPAFHIASDANDLIRLARKLAAKKVSVTALLVPAGTSRSTWGTYSMPSKRGKRQATQHFDPEEPLSAAFESAGSVLSSGMVQLTASNSSSNHTNNKPLSGIFPACFTSQKACESTTRGCTGHGKCSLKYTDKDKKSEDQKDSKDKKGECWSCQCGSTKSKGLTTYWAGPACQKKDISSEFWLIALFTVGLFSLVAFAVGNLISMGNQELPSVIGAGVGGPTARK